jgi:CheY-like chemotaxis protein
MPVILHIEDNEGDTVLMSQALEEIGAVADYRVVTSGALALRYLQRLDMYSDAPRPDLIVVDLNMPVMNGLTFLERARDAGFTTGIPVLVVTSSQREADRARSLALGAVAFHSKPDTYAGTLELARTLMTLAG